MHPVIEAIVAHLPAALTRELEANPFARKERAGWIHCSDLNLYGNRKRIDYGFCLRQCLGLPVEKSWTAEAVYNIGIGLGIDAVTRLAMEAATEAGGISLDTQVPLRDETLRLSGTPDLVWDRWGESIVGDIKSTDRWTLQKYWGNPDWPLSRAAFWRQLQAYLLLLGTDEGVFIAANREGDRETVANALVARPFYRDEETIQSIIRDVTMLRDRAVRYEATEDPRERADLLRFAG